MPAFTGDTLATYGGALSNFSPVVDPTTDLDAASGNKWAAGTACVTKTGTQAWARITVSPGAVGSAQPLLVSHAAQWGNILAVAPTLARISAGTYTITWSATQSDEIPIGLPGYTGPTAINFRAGWGNFRTTGASLFLSVVPTSSNVVQLTVSNVSGTISDPGPATDIDVFLI